MRYILTESQYNLVLESQKHEQLFQDLIDSNLKMIRNSTGMPLILDYQSTNTNTQFDW